MTIVKTTSVCSAAHMRNLRDYLDDPKAVYREVINLPSIENWEAEMSKTRELYGHDKASRKGSKNTILYHQILAFNPDECALNGRTSGMGLGDVVEYARRWCEREYPDQEVIMVAHRERCESDGTDRWAVHLGVNRSDLRTGLRYNPGLPNEAKRHRAELKQELDAEFGLRMVERGKTNSKIHHRQPSKAVREIENRGGRSEVLAIMAEVERVFDEAKTSRETANVNAFAEMVNGMDTFVEMDASGQDLKFVGNHGYAVRGATMGLGLDYLREEFRSIRACLREQVRWRVVDAIGKVVGDDYVRTMFGMAQALKRCDVGMDYEDETREIAFSCDGEVFEGPEVGASRDDVQQMLCEKDARFGGAGEQHEDEWRMVAAYRAPHRKRNDRHIPEKPMSLIDAAKAAHADQQRHRTGGGRGVPEIGTLDALMAEGVANNAAGRTGQRRQRPGRSDPGRETP